MEKKEKLGKKVDNSNNVKFEEIEGLSVNFTKEFFKKEYPNLMSEISDNSKTVKIDAVDFEIEEISEEKSEKEGVVIHNELINPKTIDFLRRCSKNEEAFEILDFLLKRNEISTKDYTNYRSCIEEEGGLSKLIEESGGLKKPGYYLDEYYFSPNENKKSKQNKKKL